MLIDLFYHEIWRNENILQIVHMIYEKNREKWDQEDERKREEPSTEVTSSSSILRSFYPKVLVFFFFYFFLVTRLLTKLIQMCSCIFNQRSHTEYERKYLEHETET